MASGLFGTDGVRGKAGHYPLDADTVTRLGASLARALLPASRPPRLVVGRDTRESGPWLEQALARGVRAEGASLTSAGVLPTPAVAYVTAAMGFDAGLVISASHNPYEDNGIKVFSAHGAKLTDALEARVDALMARSPGQAPMGPLESPPCADFTEPYLGHVRLALPEPRRLGALGLAVDVANGATTVVAPRLFRELGFDAHVLHGVPDGRNINRECGSTHPESLARAVIDGGYRLGVAFDGDGDRAIFVDHRGRVVNGDAVLLLCAKHLKTQGRLRGNTVVATVMSNIGLELALREVGVTLVRCPVGDKYVTEEMVARDAALGGEQSGHIIFPDSLMTGDGLVTTLNVLRVMADTGRELADLAGELTAFPQVLVNVRVREKRDLEELPAVGAAMERVEARLAGHGRLLVRYSGTEPLLRIMIEGREEHQIQAWATEIADEVRHYLG